MRTKTLILYCSTHGHVAALAQSVAAGAREVDDVEVDVKRVPDTLREETARAVATRLPVDAPVACPDDLVGYDAILFGTPNGSGCAQIRDFLDQTGVLWMNGVLIGKVGSVFTSTATRQGELETTITSVHSSLLNHGMVVVDAPHFREALLTLREETRESTRGSDTLADPEHGLPPPESELGIARFQGRHVAQITRWLFAGSA